MQSQPVIARTVTVKLENGLHLVPSSKIVQLVQKCGCSLKIRKGDQTVDGTSVLELLTLAAERGTQLHLEATGDQADAVLNAIAELVEGP